MPYESTSKPRELPGQLQENLQEHLKDYEPRSSQGAMIEAIQEAIEQRKILLVEAPTGTGKTLAYLLPALEWALEHKKRVVVATYTLPLQEQILKKDLPLACKMLQAQLSCAMLKGRSNYLCLKKAQEWVQLGARHEKGAQHLEGVANWMRLGREGHRSEGPPLDHETWQELAADEECTRQKCAHYADCFYFSHRKKAQSADVLIINHHLIAQEIKRRRSEGSSLVGDWDLLIIDEAHHLTDVLTRQLAITLSHEALAQVWARLWVSPRARAPARGWLAIIDQRLAGIFSEVGSKAHLLWSDITQAVDRHWELVHELSQAMGLMAFSAKKGVLELEAQWIAKESFERLLNPLKAYEDSLDHTIAVMSSLGAYFKQLEESASQTHGSSLYQEWLVHQRLLDRHREDLRALLTPYDPKKQVAWMEWEAQGRWQMVLASLDLAEPLHQHLVNHSHAMVMCSATLGGCQQFEPLVSEMHFDSAFERVEKLSLPSNFDWQKQSLLIACEDMPDPNSPQHLVESIGALREILKKFSGRALILTTSMVALRKLAGGLQALGQESSHELLVQGQASREQLLKRFAAAEDAILLGADSFWEGIDLDGEAISLVVIVKLPFEVPSDPLLKAKAKHFFGKEAFGQFLLPRAVLRFQQGIGRLLRHSQDRGCVVCLDSRLCSSRYGARFTRVVQPAAFIKLARSKLADAIDQFLSR